MNEKQFARTKAIAVLECMAIDLTGALAESSKTNPMTEVLEQRLEAIDTAQTALREQPQWISVEDALPVINDNEPLEEFATDRGYTFIVSDGKYVWTELFLLKANKFDDESVTHWMVLPKPPKEEV